MIFCVSCLLDQIIQVLVLFIPGNQSAAFGNIFEPRHDKTNKMSVHPAKTQVSQGIRPV